MCYIQNKNRQHTAERHLVRNLGSGAEGFVFIIQSKHLTLPEQISNPDQMVVLARLELGIPGVRLVFT